MESNWNPELPCDSWDLEEDEVDIESCYLELD